MNWRRCCIDVDDDGKVIGASVEFYNDVKLRPSAVAVLARGEWNGRSARDVLQEEQLLEWPAEGHGFFYVGLAED